MSARVEMRCQPSGPALSVAGPLFVFNGVRDMGVARETIGQGLRELNDLLQRWNRR